MTKKVYTKPELKSEAFVPQTHVAACGDSGTVYKFTCNAPSGTLYYFRDKPASGSHPTIGDQGIRLGNYQPCSAFHEAEAQSGFYWGYVDYNYNQIFEKNELVIVWRGQKGWEGHATKNLDINSWETAKS